MFWLTESTLPASRHSRSIASASARSSASGFCARIALTCGCFSAWRISAGLLVGREGDVDDLDLGVLDQPLAACRGRAPMPQRLATSAALAGVREAIATTGKPASA